MKTLLRTILMTGLVTALAASPALAQEADEGARMLTPAEMLTPQTQKAIERGLAYLASIQQDDGSYAYQGSAGNTGITALAGLAFLAGGNTPGRGKYGGNVEKATEYILKHTRNDGFITAGNSRMYEHGFAALFLAEVYGMTGKDEVKQKLALAIGLIERTQNGQGGWRYNPVPYDADISVTICQIMALRAARNSGIQVSKAVIDGGIKYVKACQNGDGGFSYIAGSQGSGFARTAAGVCSLYYAGEYEDKSIKRGLDYLYKTYKNDSRQAGGHFHYGHYYAVQAMWQAGGKYWNAYYPTIRDAVLKQQASDGSWKGYGQQAYASSMSLIILQVPYRYLPVLQR